MGPYILNIATPCIITIRAELIGRRVNFVWFSFITALFFFHFENSLKKKKEKRERPTLFFTEIRKLFLYHLVNTLSVPSVRTMDIYNIILLHNPPFLPLYLSLSHFWNKHNTKYRPLSSSPLLPLTATISVVFLFLSLSLFPFWSNLA